MDTSFVVAYFFLGGLVFLGVCSFFVATSVRNRLVELIAQAANIPANPLATLAAGLRSFADDILGAIPENAFEGSITRLFYAVAFFVLLAVDLALAGARLAAMFGSDAESLPFDLSWATGLGWVVAAAVFFAVSLTVRQEDVGHPFDQLQPRWLRWSRILSDACLVAVVVSAIVFYALGALLMAGSAPTVLSIIFQSLLGLAILVAGAIAGWAGLDSFVTLYAVLLICCARIVMGIAKLPDLLVIAIRRTAYLVMAIIDLPLLGVIRPLLAWWAKSRFGKALGFAPLEEPRSWPPVGYPEAPVDEQDGEEPLLFPLGEHAEQEDAA